MHMLMPRVIDKYHVRTLDGMHTLQLTEHA